MYDPGIGRWLSEDPLGIQIAGPDGDMLVSRSNLEAIGGYSWDSMESSPVQDMPNRYDPARGWVSIGRGDGMGESNLYRYAHNAPTDATDPSGEVVHFLGLGYGFTFVAGGSFAIGKASDDQGNWAIVAIARASVGLGVNAGGTFTLDAGTLDDWLKHEGLEFTAGAGGTSFGFTPSKKGLGVEKGVEFSPFTLLGSYKVPARIIAGPFKK